LGGDDMVLLSFVESRNSFDAHVVGLCGARGENDFLGVCADQLANILRKEFHQP